MDIRMPLDANALHRPELRVELLELKTVFPYLI